MARTVSYTCQYSRWLFWYVIKTLAELGGCWIAGTVGLNPARGMNVSLLCVLCAV